jgi:hypothetical protein
MKASQLLTIHMVIPLANRDTVTTLPSRHNMNKRTALHQEADALAYRGQVVS